MMTKHGSAFGTIVNAGVIVLFSFTAYGQDVGNAYRGMFVCEQVPGAIDILHVPIDLVTRGDSVQFARPLFNLQGTRVVGSELGAGTIDPTGKLHITSEWYFRGITVRGDYSGTLTSTGGTLSGMQSWRGPEGAPRSRTCELALVPAPKARHAENEQ
jgi:hypothetical protein